MKLIDKFIALTKYQRLIDSGAIIFTPNTNIWNLKRNKRRIDYFVPWQDIKFSTFCKKRRIQQMKSLIFIIRERRLMACVNCQFATANILQINGYLYTSPFLPSGWSVNTKQTRIKNLNLWWFNFHEKISRFFFSSNKQPCILTLSKSKLTWL